MAFPTPKELKRLADACRKSGIKHFKCAEMEFTLEDAPEPTNRSKTAPKANHGVTDSIETDSLSPEELLFWSAGVPNVAEDSQQ